MEEIEKLKSFLKNLSPGEIKGENENFVISQLFDIWDLLEKFDDTSLTVTKLHRMENLVYEPPNIIKFEIERHGSTMMGSVYADVHLWTIDLDNLKASCNKYYKKRLVGKRDAPLKVKPLAQKVIDDILNLRKDSNYIEWKSDKKIKVLIGNIIPETNQQTTHARRKRFRKCLEELLQPLGWKKTAAYHIYEKE